MNTVRVQLGERSYDVLIGSGLLGSAGQLVTEALGTQPTRAFCVIDTGVPDSMCETLEESLGQSGMGVSSSSFEPSESVKTIESWESVLFELASTGQERSEPVIALGGGIVGDVTGFVAASYRRGAPVIQCPSTLLAMVDASVGGKTGVNLEVELDGGVRLLKNLVGAFHQPKVVLADIDLLDSLDERQFRAGLGECLKHGLISQSVIGEDLLSWTEEHLESILERDKDTLIELVTRNVSLKAAVVAADEHENASSDDGGRALLNLGHTFGHAIETLPGISPDSTDPSLAPLFHGEGVALGLRAATATAIHLGLADGELQARVENVILRAGLPTRVHGLPENPVLFDAMRHDKKTRGGQMRFVLPTGHGSSKVVENPPKEAVFAGLDSIRA